MTDLSQLKNPRVVIVGAGFGGLSVARALSQYPFEIVLLDRKNHHLFQPLLYQVATASLSAPQIAFPIRSVLKNRTNCTVLMDEVVSIDPETKIVQTTHQKLNYDVLVLAPGSETSYFGQAEWGKASLALKSLKDAVHIREQLLHRLEKAESSQDPDVRRRLLRTIIIGGGPTGVELAGAISELTRSIIGSEYNHIQRDEVEIYLIEAGPRLLSAFLPTQSAAAKRKLELMGVQVLTETRVENLSDEEVRTNSVTLQPGLVLWAAGVEYTQIKKWLHTPVDSSGRALVQNDLRLPHQEDIYVIGDAAKLKDPNIEQELPAIAPVALQQGLYVARHILFRKRVRKKDPGDFAYHDRGMLATVGWTFAIGTIGKWQFTGRIGWLIWSFVHIYFLVGIKNRIQVFLEWVYYYFTKKKSVRILVKESEE